ncbi:MAG: hypothetical protein PHI90_06520 [Clostridia bacterium]|nr:hypothetical protein [Clostridia bacterium]MDD4048464.1 hypothetical protein [Clostridia bacterium]
MRKPLKEQFEEAFTERIKKYAEGDPFLEKALLTLNNNGIETFGCCAGHNRSDYSYIAMRIPEPESKGYSGFKNLCNKLSQLPNVMLTFGISNIREKRSEFTIECSTYNREEVFSLIT